MGSPGLTIAAEAADNTNVGWKIEFQEELVERLYRKMVALLEKGILQDIESGDEGKAGRDKKKRKKTDEAAQEA